MDVIIFLVVEKIFNNLFIFLRMIIEPHQIAFVHLQVFLKQ